MSCLLLKHDHLKKNAPKLLVFFVFARGIMFLRVLSEKDASVFRNCVDFIVVFFAPSIYLVRPTQLLLYYDFKFRKNNKENIF